MGNKSEEQEMRDDFDVDDFYVQPYEAGLDLFTVACEQGYQPRAFAQHGDAAHIAFLASQMSLDFVAYSIDVSDRHLKAMLRETDPYEAFLVKRLQNLEVVYGKLSPSDQALFDEAMAKELVEWVQREAVRKCHNEAEQKEA